MHKRSFQFSSFLFSTKIQNRGFVNFILIVSTKKSFSSQSCLVFRNEHSSKNFFFFLSLINHMSKSQDFSHARQVQSNKKTKKKTREKNRKQREVCHSSQIISYIEVKCT
jgi:hypothetical protein